MAKSLILIFPKEITLKNIERSINKDLKYKIISEHDSVYIENHSNKYISIEHLKTKDIAIEEFLEREKIAPELILAIKEQEFLLLTYNETSFCNIVLLDILKANIALLKYMWIENDNEEFINCVDLIDKIIENSHFDLSQWK